MKLSVVLLFLFFSARAFAEFPLWDEPSRKFKQGLWEFQAQGTYFEATANYSKDGGTYSSLPGNSTYHLIDFDYGAHYGFSKNWGLSVSSQVASAESQTSGITRSNSSATQIVLGTDYLIYSNGTTDLFPDLSLIIPLQRVDAIDDTVLNSEGSVELSTRLIGRTRWGFLEPFAFVGFTYRDEGRSSLVPYGLGSELPLNFCNFGAELRGYQTVINDKYSNDPTQRQVAAMKDGYSLKFYSVDQSLLETNLWLRSSSAKEWSWKVGGGTTLTGSSTTAGWSVFAGLGWNLEGSTPSMQRPSSLNPLPPKPKEDVDRFEEDITDGVNQRYFEKPKPPPSAPVPETILKPRVVPKGKSKIDRAKRKQQIQNELDQTEFQIELKRKKKQKPPTD